MILFVLLFAISPAITQVNFTQTSDADFNLGAYNQLIVGGNSIYLQHAATNPDTWLTTTVLPQTLCGHKTVTWHDKIVYLVGGFNNVNYSSSVYAATIYSAGITSWVGQNSLPQGLRDAAVVIGDNTIYVLGGRNASQVFNTIYMASISPDGTLGPWQSSAVSLPVALWGHAAAYHKGYIYVSGGSSVLTPGTALSSVYFASVNVDNTLTSFQATTALPGSRNSHSMVVYGDKLYVLGGFNNVGVKRNNVYSGAPGLNGSISSWTNETPLPVAISNQSAVVANGLILVMAGETGSGLSNATYYADADAGSLSWLTSPYTMYDNTKDGSAFSGNGIVIYSGGTDLSGTPIFNCRYSSLNVTGDVIHHATFVSYPFFQLGAERQIDSLTFHATYDPLFANCQVSYRSAMNDGIWSDWQPLSDISPIIVNQVKRYIQYSITFTSSSDYNVSFENMTLTTPGTQLAGNLDGIATFTKALSPYWATDNIYFYSGTHIFEAGATILFLPQTYMYVGNANIRCNGNVTDSVKFLYFTSETGKWRGIVFDDASDDGVSSQFYYTVIAQAGAPGYNANLYCYNTNEPYLSHCTFRHAQGNGISLDNSHISISNSLIKSNNGSGLYVHNSSPHLVGCSISSNTNAGVYLTSTSSLPTYHTTTIDHNLCGFRYPSPNFTFYQPNGSPVLSGNTYNGLAIDGGSIDGAYKTWNAISYEYFLLGPVYIGNWYSNTRLTVEPGNVIKGVAGALIQVGNSCCYGGELYAIGSADSLITFTSASGSPGGWEGIYFHDNNDSWGGTSSLVYCKIENGNSYNLAAINSGQPALLNVAFNHSAGDGLLLSNSSISPKNCTFSNNASNGLAATSSNGNITGCQFTANGGYPIRYNDWTNNFYIRGNTYSGNNPNYIALAGGDYSDSRYLYNDGIPYHVLADLRMVGWMWHPRLTIQPGTILAFNPGAHLQLGEQCCFGGDLWAEGNADSLITFKPYNNLAGGWGGIYFNDGNDNWGGVSSMKYCIVEKGADYNLYCNQSYQPAIDYCSFLNSNGNGVVLTNSHVNLYHSTINNSASQGLSIANSYGEVHNCLFQANGSYPIQFTDWNSVYHLAGNSYSGNAINYIALSGGDYSDSRTIFNDGIPYRVLSNIRMMGAYWSPRLTVQPGVTLAFEPGSGIQLALTCCYGGSLWAEGTHDSLITFRPYNNLAGGWNGIAFTDLNDAWSGNSSMKYCLVDQGSNYNVYVESSSGQPAIEHCKFSRSTGSGLLLTSYSNLSVKNTTFSNNASYGIHLESGSNLTVGNAMSDACNFFGNGPYHIYNATGNIINARYNYWGSADSNMISRRIYDKFDNSGYGIVKFIPVVTAPHLLADSMQMTGWLKYANTSLSPMKNAAVTLKNSAGDVVASATSGLTGDYSFSKIPSGSYNLQITPSDPWGAANSTDALMILNHFAQISLLNGMPLSAADVNNSHSVNATDALLIMKRYAGQISSFVAGDFMNHSDTVIENGDLFMNNIKLLCMGDVNASFTPAAKSSQSVMLITEGSITTGSFMEFDFPVRMKTGMQTGAISLGFNYPQEYLEIIGAQLANGNADFSWSAENGLFRMGWADLTALSVGNDEVFVTVKMRSKDMSSLSLPIMLTLYDDTEFADGSATVSEDVILSVPVINAPLTGLQNIFSDGGLCVHPNPCKTKVNLDYGLAAGGDIMIRLVTMTGFPVAEMRNSDCQPGRHHDEFNVSTLAPGIYLLKFEFTNRDQTGSRMVKIVVTD